MHMFSSPAKHIRTFGVIIGTRKCKLSGSEFQTVWSGDRRSTVQLTNVLRQTRGTDSWQRLTDRILCWWPGTSDTGTQSMRYLGARYWR